MLVVVVVSTIAVPVFMSKDILVNKFVISAVATVSVATSTV
jgi:hypothetical protein